MIALEHVIKINKASTALILGVLLWVIYILFLPEAALLHNPGMFEEYIRENPSVADMPFITQCQSYIANFQIVEVLGDISETLFFLIGAMTIVEVIDVHGGFAIITNRITTRSKTTLLWIISFVTFFLSAILDNMTTSIVMVMLIRRIIVNYKERWLFASIIIIAANSGGAWSPIGDITTIMLWVKGNISSLNIIKAIIIPSMVSCIIPTWISTRLLRGVIRQNSVAGDMDADNIGHIMPRNGRLSISILGVLCLISVPIFKSVTHLPPFMGVLIALGVLWGYTEIMYSRFSDIDEAAKHRVPRVIRRIDTPTILFFMGILMSVSALQHTGLLGSVANFLDEKVHNIYATNIIIGLLSSVVDNVPLVAASIGMYPLADAHSLTTAIDPAYMGAFVKDGTFWNFLAYCAGVGGSVLIIGSVAGVVIMGIEKISFGWYLKNISLMAILGYLAGALVYILINK